MLMHISWFCPLKGPTSNDYPVAMSKTKAQILHSKYYSSLNPGFLGKMANSRAREQKVQHELERLLCHKERKCSENNEDLSKGYSNQSDTVPKANLGQAKYQVNNNINGL